jgi:hypothetical protein
MAPLCKYTRIEKSEKIYCGSTPEKFPLTLDEQTGSGKGSGLARMVCHTHMRRKNEKEYSR